MQASLNGNDEYVRVTQGLYRKKTATSADVDQAKSEREIVAWDFWMQRKPTQEEAGAGRDFELAAGASREARGAGNARLTRRRPRRASAS